MFEVKLMALTIVCFLVGGILILLLTPSNNDVE